MQVKSAKRALTGVLLLDKPVGIVSNAALQRVKRRYRAAKAGLTGILDPLASGLLPICFGEATKFAQYPTDADKAYELTMQLGVTTDTGDREGQVLSRQTPAVALADVREVLSHFQGEVQQTPPMYSALKHQGQPLYRYARAGVEIERKPRTVHLHRIELLDFRADTLSLAVDCSKGTYIRVLAEDIGRQLGCGAHLTALRRTRVGRFGIADAVSLESIDAMDDDQIEALLLPMDRLLAELPGLSLERDAAARLRQGNRVSVDPAKTSGRYRIYDDKQSFIGVGEIVCPGQLQPSRLVREAGTIGAAPCE